MMIRYGLAAALVSCALAGATAWAEEDLVDIEEVVTGLDNPSGLAIQPTTGIVFVSDSAAGKIIRWDPNTKKTEDVVTGFPKDVYGKGPMYDIGPLGLAFVGQNVLVVGGGGNVDEKEIVRVYDVPEVGKTIKAEEMKQSLGPLEKNETLLAEGNFYAVAVTPDAIFVTANGDDTKGWVVRSTYKDGKFGDLERYIATKEAVNLDAPVGIAVSPLGRIVVGQMGEISEPKDSQLSFYKPGDKKMIGTFKTGLYDIAGLAYGPTGNHLLYAVDFAWMDSTQGGLFRLDDDGSKGVKTLKLASLDKPTAVAVGEGGSAIYVTVFGTAKEGEEAKPGKLLKITPKTGNF